MEISIDGSIYIALTDTYLLSVEWKKKGYLALLGMPNPESAGEKSQFADPETYLYQSIDCLPNLLGLIHFIQNKKEETNKSNKHLELPVRNTIMNWMKTVMVSFQDLLSKIGTLILLSVDHLVGLNH